MLRTHLPGLTAVTAPLLGRMRLPSALKYPEFRNYWFGLLASVTGYQMLVLFTLGWLISNVLTGDARYLGYMSTAIAVPAVLLNLFGGVLADKVNPRRLLGLTQLTTGVVVLVLATLVLLDWANEWHVLAAAFLIGSIQAFDTPTRQSIFPRLLDRSALSNAIALNASVWTGTRIFGPLVAGIIIGRADVSTAIYVSAVGFLVMALISQMLKPAAAQRARGSVLKEMASGFSFIKGSPIFSLLIGMTFFHSLFGVSYVFLMPLFADEVFEVGPEKIGWLMGAAGLGALIGIVLAAHLTKSRYKGWLLIVGAGLFGAFLIFFALTSNAGLYGASMVMLFVADLCFAVYLMMVMTTLQTMVPDGFRGRVMGFYAMTWSLVPLGGLQSSQIAHYIGGPEAVGIGGVLVLALTLVVAVFSRRVRTLGSDSGDP